VSKKNSNTSFIQNAFYPGGREALKAFISANLQYPKRAIERQIEGTVHAEYQVNHMGKVVSVKTLTNFGYGLEEEAVRLTKLLKFAVPQKVRNVRVIFNKTIWISFKLPKTSEILPTEEPPAEETVAEEKQAVEGMVSDVIYTIVPTPKITKEIEESEKQAAKKITYSIILPNEEEALS
jgi:TonB family protein